MTRGDEPLEMLKRSLVSRELGPVAARMLGDELRYGRELRNRVRGVEFLELGARDEFWATRIVRAEEVEFAEVERSPEREALLLRRAALKF